MCIIEFTPSGSERRGTILFLLQRIFRKGKEERNILKKILQVSDKLETKHPGTKITEIRERFHQIRICISCLQRTHPAY